MTQWKVEKKIVKSQTAERDQIQWALLRDGVLYSSVILPFDYPYPPFDYFLRNVDTLSNLFMNTEPIKVKILRPKRTKTSEGSEKVRNSAPRIVELPYEDCPF